MISLIVAKLETNFLQRNYLGQSLAETDTLCETFHFEYFKNYQPDLSWYEILVGQKKNCTASVLYLFEVWVPVQTGPVTPIFLGSVRYSRQFAVSSLDRWSRLDFPFSYILEKRKKPRLVSNAQTQLKMSDCESQFVTAQNPKRKKCLISSKFLIHFWRW